jgi:aryl-phospho-beta-D-glucosidase BglC (GH1 family)
MKSRIICRIIILCLAVALVIPPLSVAAKSKTSSNVALDDFDKNEIKEAIEKGIVPKTMQGNYDNYVTAKEFYLLLSNSINKMTGKTSKTLVSKVKKASTKKYITRQEAAYVIYNTAKKELKIKKGNGTLYYNGSGYTCKDEADFDGNYWDSIIFVLSDYDITSNATIMLRDTDYNFRPRAKMTRAEAIQATYRLTNSIIPNASYESMDQVESIELSKEQMQQANSMPEATTQKLPAWSGLTLMNQHHDGETPYYMGTFMFAEGDMKTVSELGFNFSRVPLNYYVLCKSEQDPQVNMTILKNLDNLVEWGIKYKVHMCIDMHSMPGFRSMYVHTTTFNEDFFTNEARQQLACKFFAMLAKRYKNVPNNVLSFDLLNEPLDVKDETYANVMKKLINAIRQEDPKRLIVVDGLQGKTNAVAERPVGSLADADVVQSMHYYIPNAIICNTFNYDGFGPQSWPLPYVNGWVWGAKHDPIVPLTIEGDFIENTKLAVRISGVAGNGDIVVKADGKEVLRKTLAGHTVGVNGCTQVFPGASVSETSASYNLEYTVTVPQSFKKIEISWEGSECYWMRLYSVSLVQPKKSNKSTPYYNAIMEGGGILYNTTDTVTNILCSPGEPGEATSKVTVSDDGTFDNKEQEALSWNIDRMREFVSVWTKFAKDNNVAVMCQEFGVRNTTSHEVTLAYMKDWLTVMKENNMPWCLWGFWDNLGILNSSRYDVKYEKYGPYLLDREMLELLQQYQ